MRAIVAVPGSAAPQLVDVAPPPDPAPGEVICQTLELGVCGTDREILHSQRPHLPPDESQLILGHECLARVVAVGSGVDNLHVNDLVVPLVRRATDRSTFIGAQRADMLPWGMFVERGIYAAHGFSAEHWLDRPEFLLRVDPSLASVAVFAEPLSVCEKAVNEVAIVQQARLANLLPWCELPPRVLVTGLGPIAFAGLIAASARGWPVTVCGRDRPDSFRATLAQRWGAQYLQQTAEAFTPSDLEREGFDLLLECTGSEEVLVEATLAVRACGAIVWLGATRAPEPKPLAVAHMMGQGILRNHLHLATVNSAPRDFRDALEHLAQLQTTHPSELAALFTARVPCDASALWHYEHREPQGIKTIVAYG